MLTIGIAEPRNCKFFSFSAEFLPFGPFSHSRLRGHQELEAHQHQQDSWESCHHCGWYPGRTYHRCHAKDQDLQDEAVYPGRNEGQTPATPPSSISISNHSVRMSTRWRKYSLYPSLIVLFIPQSNETFYTPGWEYILYTSLMIHFIPQSNITNVLYLSLEVHTFYTLV